MRTVGAVYLLLMLLLGSFIAAESTQAQTQTPASARPISFYLPDTLPPGLPTCLHSREKVTLDFTAMVQRFPGVPDAAARLEALGWEEGFYREFGCTSPPATGVSWLDMSVHRFGDSASAAAAIPFFADSRAFGTPLQPAPASKIGDSTAAIAGPAGNGTEYTLYVSSGPLLFRVTGIAPVGDPRPNVDYVMTALYLISIMMPPVGGDVSPPVATLSAADATTRGAAYTILDLGTGNGNWSSATHINNRGQILLTTGTTNDPMTRLPQDQRAVIWQNGGVTDLTSLGIGNTIAINDLGTVVAAEGGRNLLYESDSGSLTSLLGFSQDAYPADINNSGAVTGQVGDRAVIATAGNLMTIPIPLGCGFVSPAAINEAGHIAGTARPSRTDDSIQRAVLFAGGVVTVLGPAPGASSSRAIALNDVDQVVGIPGIRGMHSIPEYGRAFLYDRGSGTTTDLGTLPGYQNSVAFAINNVGQVVGFAWLPLNEADPIRRAYVYDHRTGVMTDLNQLIPQESGWYLVDAVDINNSGQIVGRGLIGGEMHAFVLTPVQ